MNGEVKTEVVHAYVCVCVRVWVGVCAWLKGH